MADEVSNLLAGLQERFYQYRNDEALLDEILRQGAEKARARAERNPCQSVRSRRLFCYKIILNLISRVISRLFR